LSRGTQQVVVASQVSQSVSVFTILPPNVEKAIGSMSLFWDKFIRAQFWRISSHAVKVFISFDETKTIYNIKITST